MLVFVLGGLSSSLNFYFDLSCDVEREFLGFYNRTCDAGTANGSWDSKRVGPNLRTSSAITWRHWNFTKVGENVEGHDLVTIKTYYPNDEARWVYSKWFLAEVCFVSYLIVVKCDVLSLSCKHRCVSVHRGDDRTIHS